MQTQYASKSTISKLNGLNTLLELRQNYESGMEDHVFVMEAQLFRLGFKNSDVSESMKVALFI